ncbi:redoxin domain-containing protein [Sphingobium olei]|jgi:thiol-disulfide isomerase/thioredoxin|uniref:Redoxin domain-containing protein n=1 Tax=Sphingobium olei TaxID=420955 RepID=A0ABW3NVR4_9SPHN
MDGVIRIGFLALAVDRLLAVVAIMVFVAATPLLAERLGVRRPRVFIALLAGISVARIAFVLQNLDAFVVDPASALWFWQGGFTLWPGAVTAAIVLASGLRPRRRAGALAAVPLLIAGLWVGAHRILAVSPRPLPSGLVVSTVEGKIMHLDKLRGQPFVLNLWATWCPPCQRELPMMVDVASATPIPVLFVNQGETADRIRTFLRARKLTKASVLSDPNGRVATAIGSPALPTTLSVDAEGKVRARHFGEISRAAFIAAINDLERNPT